MMSRLSRVIGLAALFGAALACEAQRGALYVDVQTDLVPELELATLEIEILDTRERVVARAGPVALRREDASAFLERGVRVASFEALASGVYTVRVAGRETAPLGLPLDGGPILVERSVLVSLDSSRVVRVVLGARCTDVVCPDGDEPELTACLNGRCVSPRCDVSEGAVCDEPAPCVSGDPEACTPPPDCAAAICRDGACLNEPIAGACADGEYCGRFGCESIPGVLPPDAGTPDAYVELPDAFDPPPPDASGPCGPIGTPCDDGNACTTTDVCRATGCEGTPRTGTCGTQNECRSDTCMAGVCTVVNRMNGLACGTRNTCRLDACMAGVCTRVNAGNGTDCGTQNACRNDGCMAGVCERVNRGNGTACTDSDSNACTSGQCDAGSCRPTRRADGTGCGSGNLCCSGSCINPDTNGAHCGVCGVSCGGRGCHQGLCECSTNPQCTGELGGAATCWDSNVGGDPTDGLHCQCQCETGTTCAACPGAARCREMTGYNRCYYP